MGGPSGLAVNLLLDTCPCRLLFKPCRPEAGCNKACQQRHSEDKHLCKKLREGSAALGAAERRSAAAGGPPATGSAGNRGSEDKNNALPLPKQMVVSNEEFRELVAAAPSRSTPVGLR